MSRMPHKSLQEPDLRTLLVPFNGGAVQINVNRLKMDDLDEITIDRVKTRAGGIEVTYTRSYLDGTRERQGVAFFEARENGPYIFKQNLVIAS